MDCPPCIEETTKRAIAQGVDPAGEDLERFMPRWKMFVHDMDDLMVFVKALK